MFANFFGLLLAGMLPGLIAGILNVGAESPTAYRGALLVGAALYAVALLPLMRTRTEPLPRSEMEPIRLREMFQSPGLLVRLFLPQVVIGLGAGALVPFLNLFFKAKFGMPDAALGTLFAVQSVLMGFATLVGPVLSDRWGKVKTVVGMQVLSVPFLGVLGYVPMLSFSAAGFLLRGALMNAANPLYTAFVMEKVPTKQRGTASAMMQISWQGTRALSSLGSGYLQEISGFTLLFPITIVTYLMASVLIYVFFLRWKRDETAAAGNPPGSLEIDSYSHSRRGDFAGNRRASAVAVPRITILMSSLASALIYTFFIGKNAQRIAWSAILQPAGHRWSRTAAVPRSRLPCTR
jgi:MFS family permease